MNKVIFSVLCFLTPILNAGSFPSRHIEMDEAQEIIVEEIENNDEVENNNEEAPITGYYITFANLKDYNRFKQLNKHFKPGIILNSWQDELKIEFFIDNSDFWITQYDLEYTEMTFYTFLYNNGFGRKGTFQLDDKRIVPALVEWGRHTSNIPS